MQFFLSVPLLTRLWPHARPEVIAGVSASSTRVLDKYKITMIPELIDFMAECSEETGGMIAFTESGNYSAERAHEVWPSLFPTVQSAQAVVTSPRLLFNKTYGGRLGNFSGTDDGYLFRGRGMIQITGRNWYTSIGKVTGIDLVNNPDLAAAPENLLECAAAFWMLDGVNSVVGDFRAEVKKINGGYINMAQREAWRLTCQKLFYPSSAVQAPGVSAPQAPAVASSIVAAGGEGLHPSFLKELEALLLRWL